LAIGGCHDDTPLGIQADVQATQQRDTALVPVADTYIRQGSPNQNQGGETILRLQSSGHNRALLRWDAQAVAGAVAGGTLVSARIELTITDNGENWGTSGRAIAIHRLTQDWTELGATWNCAVDAIPTNQSPNCSGATAWEMGNPVSANPFAPVPTATAIIYNGQGGVVSFDVTSDVAAMLAGQASHGWILKKVEEGQNGRVEFGSRESTLVPHLRLTIESSTDASRPPVPNGAIAPAVVLEVSSPGDARVSYHRNRYEVRFADTTSGATIRAFLVEFHGVIVGGFNENPAASYYLLQVPDPGNSWSAVDSLASAMARNAGVEWAHPSMFRALILRSRFPVDAGTAPTRAFWRQPVAALRNFNAVRAPLAWGCETGLYGGRRAIVGVVDAYFDVVPSDLANSMVAPVVPPDSAMVANPAPDDDEARNHGIGVAGVISARGDNGIGGAGMAWQSSLHVYALRSGQRIAADELHWFILMLARTAIDGVQALNLSLGIGPSGDTSVVRQLRDAVRFYLDSGPDRLVVQAIGNDNVTLTIDSLSRSTDTRVTALDRALAQLYAIPTYRARIIFVTGAGLDQSHFAFTNTWIGDGVLVAPAESVRTLSGQSGMQWGFMTSFSAPFVAGAAAQLWAFDSTLTGADVKQFLLEGARVARADSNGVMRAPDPVPGAQGAYLLDAYGALTRLAAARSGLPVCGYPVRVAPDDPTRLLFERPLPLGPFPMTVPGAGWGVSGLSVAQGGRMLSVVSSDTVTGMPKSIILSQRGALVEEIPGIRRMFLERDWVDVVEPAGFGEGMYARFALHRSGSGTTDTLDLAQMVGAPTNLVYGVASQFAPSAEYATAIVSWPGNALCSVADGATTVQWWVVPLPTGAPQKIGERSLCNPSDDANRTWDGPPSPPDVAWSHDSRRAVFYRQAFTIVNGGFGGQRSTIDAVVIGAASLEVPLPDVYATSPYFSADDIVLFAGEALVDCQLTARLTANLATLLSSTLQSPAGCGGEAPVIANVRLAGATSARAASRRSGAGFDILAVPGARVLYRPSARRTAVRALAN
jgi:hypothetical protein